LVAQPGRERRVLVVLLVITHSDVTCGDVGELNVNIVLVLPASVVSR